MGRFPQPLDGHGSLRDIQVLVNEHAHLINSRIVDAFQLHGSRIEWVSPLKKDDYAEYRDSDFLKVLGISPKELQTSLNDFWPQRGPQWDGLARSTSNDKSIFLVEAKANIPEMISPPCQAGEASRKLIQSQMSEIIDALGIKKDADWLGDFYQYANRLAHLYFLRAKNSLPAYLIFLYFINDKTVKGPASEAEWKAAIHVMKHVLRINKKHPLSKYIAEVYIDVNGIGL